jgi:hypothetical protein
VITDEDAEKGKQETTHKLAEKGVKVKSVREEKFSLEDVFISVVEKARRQGKGAAEE